MLSGRNRHLQSAIATLPSNREFAGDGGSVAVSTKLKQSMFRDHCLNKEQGIFERENRETLFQNRETLLVYRAGRSRKDPQDVKSRFQSGIGSVSAKKPRVDF